MDYIGFIALYWGLTERVTPPEVLWPLSLGSRGKGHGGASRGFREVLWRVHGSCGLWIWPHSRRGPYHRGERGRTVSTDAGIGLRV